MTPSTVTFPHPPHRMERLYKPWDTPGSLFGDVAVLGFLFVQWLDWVFTYAGIALWGPSIEANPLISSAVAVAGAGVGLTAAKLVAVSCGIVLHLRRVHAMVALLTAVYVAVAIGPWLAVFLQRL